MLFGYIILTILGLIIFGIVLNYQKSKGVGLKASKLLMMADQKYGKFIEDRINISILENNKIHIEKEQIIEDSMIVIRPYIDGLIANVNATKIKEITINYDSEFFGNIPSFLDELYAKESDNKKAKLSKEEEQQLFEIFRDTIKADVTQRFVNFKTRAL